MIKNKPDEVNRNYMSDYSVRIYGINYNVLFITGGMAGIASMEDVIETLLGLEIVDEMDKSEDMQDLARRKWEQRAKE